MKCLVSVAAAAAVSAASVTTVMQTAYSDAGCTEEIFPFSFDMEHGCAKSGDKYIKSWCEEPGVIKEEFYPVDDPTCSGKPYKWFKEHAGDCIASEHYDGVYVMNVYEGECAAARGILDDAAEIVRLVANEDPARSQGKPSHVAQARSCMRAGCRWNNNTRQCQCASRTMELARELEAQVLARRGYVAIGSEERAPWAGLAAAAAGVAALVGMGIYVVTVKAKQTAGYDEQI